MSFLICHAQNDANADFEDFRSEIHKDFDNFRSEIMRDYIEFIRNPWKDMKSIPPIPKPQPEPVPPVILPDEGIDNVPVRSNPIDFDVVIKPEPIAPQPQPIEPIIENDNKNERIINLIFFGTPCNVRYFQNEKYHIGNLSEEDVADALSILSTTQYDNLIIDCLKTREELTLCDWAYLLFIQKVAHAACGEDTNEASLLEAYILLQSGYKLRFGYTGDKLYVLYASKHCMFDKPSYFIDNDNYYGIDNLPPRMMVSQAAYPNEHSISLLISQQPLFSRDMSIKRTVTSKMNPSIRAEFQTNKNLIDFYATYPSSYYDDNYMTQWSQYANTPLAEELKSSLYETLRRELIGLSEIDKVTRILNWVQTGFVYEYDDKVWGRDRTFFAEETLYYPYCDCEDRSVLLTRLVRDLLNLECLLIYYPGHLATAVNFSTPVAGDYIQLQGRKYVVCDPTYIGAPIGKTMPGMDNSKAGVILLD